MGHRRVFQTQAPGIFVNNFDTTPISYQVLLDGTPTIGPQAPLINAGQSLPVFQVLTAGQTLALSLSAANAAGITGYYMIVYERPNSPNFIWFGYPLTGVSFSTVLATVTGNVMQTLITNPVGSGKRMLIEGSWTNSGLATTYGEYRSDGTHNMVLNTSVAAAANGFSTVSYPAWLEPGESLVMQCPGSILVSLGVMSFDLSCPLKTISGWTALPAGVTRLYTVPPNTTAFMMRPQTLTQAFQVSSPFITVTNFDTTPITYQVLVDGVAITPPFGPFSAGNGALTPIFSVLTAGQTVDLSLSAANAAGITGFYTIVYERPN